VRLLLTSAGIRNPSIHDALLDTLGKPIAESSALCIPTSSYGLPGGGSQNAWRFISGQEPDCPMTALGWRSVGVLELTALPSLDAGQWVPTVRETDVLLVNGGDPMFLCHWMRQSGLAELLPSLPDTVYVGLSAGSMVMAPRIGLVDFSIFPHLDHPDLPDNTMASAERWASGIAGPAYAIDDETAIQVTDDGVQVVSEGSWRRFAA
jgi:dipeptidase E